MRPEAYLLLGSFLALIALRVPISFALGLSSLVTLLALGVNPVVAPQLIFAGMNKISLMAIPFFIMAGAVMSRGSMALKLIEFAKLFVGWMPGGLAVVNVLASMFFGSTSGSAVAATSAIGTILIDPMVKSGCDREYAVNVTVTGSTQGLLIPPSHNAIIYSLATGGVASIEALFIAGVVPGITLGLFLIATALLLAVRRGYPREFSLPASRVLVEFGGSFAVAGALLAGVHFQALSWPVGLALGAGWIGWLLFRLQRRSGTQETAKVLRLMVEAVLPLCTPLIILGGIMLGWFTAVESSVIAVVWALGVNFGLFAWWFGDTSWREYGAVVLSTLKTTALVMFLIGNATAFGYCLTRLHVPEAVTAFFLSITGNRYALLLLLNLLLLALGMIMDMAPLIIILTPILLPVVMKVGVHPVHFGMIMIANLGIGLTTPPVGNVLFVGCAVGKIKMEQVVKGIWPFYLAMVAALMLITYVPLLSLGLVQVWAGR